jgi:hypothetical protein
VCGSDSNSSSGGQNPEAHVNHVLRGFCGLCWPCWLLLLGRRGAWAHGGSSSGGSSSSGSFGWGRRGPAAARRVSICAVCVWLVSVPPDLQQKDAGRIRHPVCSVASLCQEMAGVVAAGRGLMGGRVWLGVSVRGGGDGASVWCMCVYV